MGFLDKITGLFSRGSRDESLLLKAVELAKNKKPEEALEIYNQLLASPGTSAETRARALFNRGLAYKAMRDEEKALEDLENVLRLTNLPDNILAAAKEQITRVKKRQG